MSDAARSDREELISQLQMAFGPDRKLDCDIFVVTASSPFVSYYPDCVLATIGGFSARVEIADIPMFTSSVDEALQIIPENYDWFIGRGQVFPDEPPYGVQIFPPESGRKIPMPVPLGEGEHPHLAIAICIAALEARDIPKDTIISGGLK